MLTYIIHSLEALISLLFCLLIYRLSSLYKQSIQAPELVVKEELDDEIIVVSKKSSKEADYYEKMESLKMAQTFVGSQMIELKRNFTDLHTDQLSWLREAVSLYLIGAIDFIGKQKQCGVKSRKELINIVLKSNLRISDENATQYFSEALYRKPQSDNDHMVRAGAKAAKVWLQQKAVPESFSLKEQLNDWGVFA